MASLTKQALCAVLAILGLLRLQAGMFWLRRRIRKNRGLGPEKVFDRCWAQVTQHAYFFRGAAMMRNRFSFPWKDILFLRLLEEMERSGLHYRPKLKLTNAELLHQPNMGQPLIVPTVHSPVDAILNRVFEEDHIDWTLLAAGEGATKKARLLGLQSDLNLVTRSSDTLLLLRRKLREGKLVCADIDYPRRRPNSLYCDIFLSPVLFHLAVSTKAKVVYAFARVGDKGRIEVCFGNPAVDTTGCTARDYAQDFIAWLHDAQNDPRKRQVREWTPTKKDRFRKFVLTEAICSE